MIRRSLRTGVCLSALIIALACFESAAAQQPSAPPPAAAPAPASEADIVITGSFIRGTPEDAALPVDVISTEELRKQGSPSTVELVKNVTASEASIGESNRFLGTAAGAATVNLRGFGSQRTLVLLNNRRLAPSAAPVVGGQNINLLPTAPLARVEILREGAAATYGSDAVGGVVNFITRRNFSGIQLDTEYSLIKDSDGDYRADLLAGWVGDRGDFLVSAGYRHRSELKSIDRDWAVQPFLNNFFGGWSTASNPGQYLTGSAAQLASGTFATPFLDDGCTDLGGVLASATSCRFQFTQFDNLVNEENHYQFFAQTNYDLFEDVKFHGELLWARSDVPEERVSPMQSTTQFPTPIMASGASPGGGVSPYPATGLNEQSRFYIPPSHPGLQAFLANHTDAPYYADALTNGVITSQTLWRPAGFGGNPLFDDGADRQSRMNDAWRISGGLNGRLDSGIEWDAAITYMEDRFHSETPDILTSRLELALRGLGGPNCDATTGTPGVGSCLYYNPFSNAFPSNPSLNLPNPYFDPSLQNSREVVDWMEDSLIADNTNRLLVFDFALNGESDRIELGGGPIGWAIGAQYRWDQDHRERNTLGDIEATPCVDDVIDGTPQCTNGTGPFNFYAGQTESDTDRSVWAVFAELNLPITDKFQVNAAVRQEVYESFGATTNPRVSARYEVTDWLAVRASAGTTFRAPSQEQLNPDSARILAQFNLPGGVGSLYRPVDVFGDPDLEPETADSYSAGLLFDVGGFKASIDYYKFKFKDELTTETASNLVSTMFPAALGAAGHCGEADFASLQARFTFADGMCGAANLLGVRTNVINGPSVDTSGVDVQASYDWDDVMGARVTLGGDASYLIEYQRGPVVTQEGITIASAIDRAGKSELLSAFYSYPKWKANAFLNISLDDHNLRWTTHYQEGPTNIVSGFPDYQQDDNITHDLVYQNTMIDGLTLTASVINLTDEDPPFTRSQYNYDYTMASPLGRVFKIGIRKTF